MGLGWEPRTSCDVGVTQRGRVRRGVKGGPRVPSVNRKLSRLSQTRVPWRSRSWLCTRGRDTRSELTHSAPDAPRTALPTLREQPSPFFMNGAGLRRGFSTPSPPPRAMTRLAGEVGGVRRFPSLAGVLGRLTDPG